MGVIKLRVLRKGVYSGCSGHSQCNHKGPYKREARRSALKIRKCCVVGFEHKIRAKECRWPLEDKKGRMDSPLNPSERNTALPTLVF